MIVLLVAGCFALFLAYYASRDEIPFGLEGAFLIAAFVAAIHYNYGNDYRGYVQIFHSITISDFNWFDLINKKIYKEPGWALLNYFFEPFGFFAMVAFLGVFQNFVYYLFVKRFVPKEWWVLGVFIYLFSDVLWVLNMSMMRQGLAGTLFVLAWIIGDVQKKLIPISCLILFIASTVHSSALLLLPLPLIFYLKKNITPYLTFIFLFLFVFMFFKPDLFNDISILFADVEDINRLLLKYEGSSRQISYGIGFILILLPFFLMLFFLLKNNDLSERELQCIVLASLGYLILPFKEIVPILGRYTYYFTAFSIAAIPLIYRQIKWPHRFFWLGSFLLLYIYSYFFFFYSPIWIDNYLIFHSIFEVIF